MKNCLHQKKQLMIVIIIWNKLETQKTTLNQGFFYFLSTPLVERSTHAG